MDEIDLNCPNHTTLKDYDIQVLIGQGAFGTVKRATMKKATRKSGNFHRNVAIKQYDKFKLYQDPSRVESLKREITILSQLDHPGVMKFYDAIDAGSKVSIIVEYINGNNLY